MSSARIIVIGDPFATPATGLEFHQAHAANALEILAVHRCSLALLIGLAERAELATIRMIAGAHPRLPILVVSGAPIDSHVVAAFKVGATGYLYTADLATRFPGAIHEAILGGTPMSSAIAQLVLDRARRQTRPSQHPSSSSTTLTKPLTARQREILVELASPKRDRRRPAP